MRQLTAQHVGTVDALPPRRRSATRPRGQRERRLALAAVVAVLVVAPTLWFVLSGAAGRWKTRIEQQTLMASVRAGLRVDDILVSGRVKTPRDELFTALGARRGDPILAIDLAAARKRLEAISWVRTATVERRLPNEIDLVITERAPVVVWQSHGRYFLVDRDGQVVGDQIDDYAGLPLMVGEGAPTHVASLTDLLASEPDLRPRFKTAQWVGDRRWNISLNRASTDEDASRAAEAIEIRLPEDDPQRAWHELADLEREQKLLDRQVGLVDMRLPDRLVLRVLATGSAREASSVPPVKSTTTRKPG